MLFTLLGYWVLGGGSPKALIHNLLMQFFSMGSSTIEDSETFFLILLSPKLTIQNM